MRSVDRSSRGVRRRTSIEPLLALALALSGCNDVENETPPQDAAIADSAGDALKEAPLPELAPCSANFESIRRTIILPTCAQRLCHVGGDSVVDLTSDDPHTTFIGVRSFCGDWVRVVPGDPARSLLWQKLTSDAPPCGERMPWGYVRLPDSALACIRTWIESL